MSRKSSPVVLIGLLVGILFLARLLHNSDVYTRPSLISDTQAKEIAMKAFEKVYDGDSDDFDWSSPLFQDGKWQISTTKDHLIYVPEPYYKYIKGGPRDWRFTIKVDGQSGETDILGEIFGRTMAFTPQDPVDKANGPFDMGLERDDGRPLKR